MHDKWIEGLGEEIPEGVLDEVEDPLVRVEIQELFDKLKRLDNENHRRKTELFQRHGVMFRNEQDVHLRLNLLIEMFIGHLSPERLNFEVRWAMLTKQAIEGGYSDYLQAKAEARESQSIMLPGGAVHKVPAKKKQEDADG